MTIIQESQAMALAKSYVNARKKYTNKVPNVYAIKKSKWWPFFTKTVTKFAHDKNWTPHKYVEFLFETYQEKTLPFMLPSEKNWKLFINWSFAHESDGNENGELVARDLVNSLTVVKRWCKRKGIDLDTKTYFNDKVNQSQFFRFQVSKNLMCISNAFSDYYVNLSYSKSRTLFSPEEIKKRRMNILRHKNIVKFLEKNLGKDFHKNVEF